MTPGLWGRPVHGPAGPAVSRAAGGRPLSAYSIAGARRLDMTSFLGMSALTRGGMPHVVEPAGFEPATFPLRTGRPATGRRPRSAPDPIRTGDTRIRNPVLCPLSYKGVHPPCDDMRPRTGGRIRGGSWRWRGRGRENKRRKNPSRMPSFPRAYSVACGRRSRHEPLRAPDRTRSGDLPLTRRTLCRLSYRGGCRKPPAVRRRPHAPVTGHGGGHAVVRPEGRAVYAARAGAGPPSGSRRDRSSRRDPPLRAPWRGRTSVYGFGDRRAAAVPMARSCFPLFGFQVSSPTVRAVACDGMRPRPRRPPMRAACAFRGACMHPYASGNAYGFASRFGLFPTFPVRSGGVYALYASFPYRGFEKKEGNPIYRCIQCIQEKGIILFSFIYKGFRAFSQAFSVCIPGCIQMHTRIRNGPENFTIL